MIFINFSGPFNLYIGNFLIELHFIFIALILLLIVLLCFWSYSARYSFYTFCLIHSLKFLYKPKYNWFYIYVYNVKRCIHQSTLALNWKNQGNTFFRPKILLGFCFERIHLTYVYIYIYI